MKIEWISNIIVAEINNYSENFREVLFDIDSGYVETENEIIATLENELINKDALEITIGFGIDDDRFYHTGDDKYKFIEKIDSYKEDMEEIVKSFHVRIKKQIDKGKLSIYSLEFFQMWLSDKCPEYDLMGVLSGYLKENNRIIFLCKEINTIMNTRTIYFVPDKVKEVDINYFDRDTKHKSIVSEVNFSNASEICLLPEDVDFQMKEKEMFEVICTKFQRIKEFLSMVYLSDYSYFNEGILNCRLIGYRCVNEKIDLSTYKNKGTNLIYQIYLWVYSNENITDKLQLARNVISLHCKYSSFYDLDEKTFESIKANYNIYIKKNVEEYIKLKRDCTEFLLQVLEKISGYFALYLSGFKKNVGAGVTFVIGLIFTNAFANYKFNEIFTEDIVICIYVILLASVIYCLVNLGEVILGYQEILEKLESVKINYASIISDIEVDDIWNNMLGLESEKKRFWIKTGILTFIWIILVVIVYIAVYKLSGIKFWNLI